MRVTTSLTNPSPNEKANMPEPENDELHCFWMTTEFLRPAASIVCELSASGCEGKAVISS